MFLPYGIKGRKPKHKKRSSKLMILAVVGILIGVFFVQWMEHRLKPSLLNIAQTRAKALITSIVNDAIRSVIIEQQLETDDLLTYYLNNEGIVVSFGVNTIGINKLTSDIVTEINKHIEEMGIYEVYVPFGNTLGYHMFANIGPKVPTKILPIGSVEIDYDREVKTAGINQVHHRIWLNVSMNYQIIVPMETSDYDYKQEVTLVDRIISGTVPESYLYIPDGSIRNMQPSD